MTGVIFDAKLSFKYYVGLKLGLMKRICTEFNNESALQVVYFSLTQIYNSNLNMPLYLDIWIIFPNITV